MKNFLLVLVMGVAACSAQLPDNYEVINGIGIYRFSAEMKTWTDAKLACEADGAHLAIINSPKEAEGLRGILLQYPNTMIMAYVGFEDMASEGVYKTVQGGFLSTTGYNVWKKPPTNSATNQARDCGAMFNCGRLTDVNCNELHPFICELTESVVPAE